MMQEIAPGRYQTAHYAFATALMNLGLILPGLAACGWNGYHHYSPIRRRICLGSS